MDPYLVLLQVGFSLPRHVAMRAVRSYRTISPLPSAETDLAVYFLWHFPSTRAAQALPGTLPAGARTFLPRTHPAATVQPTLASAMLRVLASFGKKKQKARFPGPHV